ncbi:MAG: quinone-dependent dihydroorotate dehydrogenase [Calditrichia bacterium]
MYKFIRKLLFLFPPEFIHNIVIFIFKLPLVSRILGRFYRFEHPALQRKLFGLTFPNPVGLAAGLDKDGEIFRQMGHLGFGFVEIGTVTPLPQPGNPKPRLFRLISDEALINRMGFNNRGVAAMVRRLRNKPAGLLVGGNIGKNKMTPNAQALQDYEKCFRALHPHVDFFVVNVSSPNTPDLRKLQEKETLAGLLQHLIRLNNEQTLRRPVLLKVAPDLSEPQLDDIIDIVQQTGIAGIVAVNTTIGRKGLSEKGAAKAKEIGDGGLSGKPLSARSTEVIRYLHRKSGGKIPIVASGGVMSTEDALEKLDAGASLVEIYTGFVYEGPGLIREINRKLI